MAVSLIGLKTLPSSIVGDNELNLEAQWCNSGICRIYGSRDMKLPLFCEIPICLQYYISRTTDARIAPLCF